MKNRSVTQGIRDKIPVWLQNLMWFLRDSIPPPKSGDMQKFQLSCSENATQMIQLSQKSPLYSRQFETNTKGETFTEIIYVFEDEENAVMMLESEFQGPKHKAR